MNNKAFKRNFQYGKFKNEQKKAFFLRLGPSKV